MKIFEITKKELLNEKWSEKYKKSIDCNNPKGFSQKAHCKGKLKEEETQKGKIHFEHEHLDHYSGQDNYELGIYEDEEVIGYVQYVIFENEITVSDILVRPNRRRENFGSMLIKKMKQLHPNAKYKPSLKTDLGSKFIHKDVDVNEQLNEKTDFSKEKKQGLHGWFARQGGKGKSKGWVDCNTCRDGKCKSCGRKEGESRSKYPACRPTPSACKTKGKGKSWGKKSKLNEDNQYLRPEEINEILKGYIETALWTEEERLNDEYGSEHNKVFKDYDDYEDKEDTELDKLIKLSANINNKGIESFSKEDIEPNSLIKAYTDIKKFIQLAGDSVYEAIYENGLERLGTDIWYTRNGHGAGFFDHSYDDDDEKKLIQAGKSLGSVDLYINDNLKLSFSNQHLYEQSKQDIKKDIKLNEIKNTFKRLLK